MNINLYTKNKFILYKTYGIYRYFILKNCGYKKITVSSVD